MSFAGQQPPRIDAYTAPGGVRVTRCQFYDAEQVRTFYADEYSACVGLGTRPVGHDRFYVAAEQLRLGPLEVTRHYRTVEMAFRMERDDAYKVCLTGSGALALDQRDATVPATSTRAVVYQPATGSAVIRTGAADRARGVLIQRWALAARLELLVGHPVASSTRMAPAIDLGTGPGRAWLDLLGVLAGVLEDPDHVALQPMVTEPLVDALMTGLLVVSEHRYSDELHEPASACRPRHVKIAIDAMHGHPEQAHTTASLARRAGVGVRSLQAGFRHYLEMSPMAYLRQVRLMRVHEDLHAGRAATVTEAAHRWGFTHLGRFAADYRAKYGELPSDPARGGDPNTGQLVRPPIRLAT
jgi:AraC-like DNA-binding protein